MKKTVCLLIVLLMVSTLFSCSGSGSSEQSSTGEGNTETAAAANTYSLDITQQVTSWKTAEKNGVSYLYAEKVMYCENPVVGAKQCLNIYVPAAYMNTDGTLNRDAAAGSYTCSTAPILYINSTGAYLGKAPYKITEASETLAGKEGWYYEYLKQGFVLVFSGARGRADYSQANNDIATGKAPIGLSDLKAGIRFIRYNAANFPGDTEKIISNGMSAGGAMSTLLAVSGNSHAFDSYLEKIGAAMDVTDDVYAAQIYCPIIDLENADLAYAWFFKNDTVSEKAKSMTGFQKALCDSMYIDYIEYLNALDLTVDGVSYTIGEDGRSGSFQDFILEQYGIAAEKYEEITGTPVDGAFDSVDEVVLTHNPRSKVSPSFDSLDLSSSENGVFGSHESSLGREGFLRHFSVPVTGEIAKLKEAFPAEYAVYYEAYSTDSSKADVQEQVRLYNPWTYLNEQNTDMAQHFRVCVGTQDSDTSPAVSAALVLKLRGMGIDTDYELIWAKGHTDADYAGAFEAWVNGICR